MIVKLFYNLEIKQFSIIDHWVISIAKLPYVSVFLSHTRNGCKSGRCSVYTWQGCHPDR